MTTALEAARRLAARMDLKVAAARAGAAIEDAQEGCVLKIPFLGRIVAITCPGFALHPASEKVDERVLALLVYYLATSDGSAVEGSWVSFADLPDGRFYCSTWRGYTGRVLVARYGNDLETLRARAERLGGEPANLKADLALSFKVLPRVPVALLYWAGDDEFEPRADFLFDASAPHHLSTDSYAVLCKWLTDELCAGGKST